MTTIGSSLVGSIAATDLGSHVQAQQTQTEQADEAAQATLVRRLADIQEHQVEDSESAQSDGDAGPEDRRPGGRRRRGKPSPTQKFEPGDLVELTSAAPQAKPAGPSADPSAAAPSAAPAAVPVAGRGGVLDVEA